MALAQISGKCIDRKGIGFLLETSSSGQQHCGIDRFKPHYLSSFEVRHQRSASGFHHRTMSVQVKDFPELRRTIIGREFLEGPHSLIVRPDSALMSPLLKLHKTVGQLAARQSRSIGAAGSTPGALIQLMVRCLAEDAGIESTMSGLRHDAIVASFEEFLEANPDRPVYLSEICASIDPGANASCLLRRETGDGPDPFSHPARNAPRRALLRADPLKSTVSRIATDDVLRTRPVCRRLSGAVRTIAFEDTRAREANCDLLQSAGSGCANRKARCLPTLRPGQLHSEPASFMTGRIPIRTALSMVVGPADENALKKKTPTSRSSSSGQIWGQLEQHLGVP